MISVGGVGGGRGNGCERPTANMTCTGGGTEDISTFTTGVPCTKLERVIKKGKNGEKRGSRDIYQLNARWSQHPFVCPAPGGGRGGEGDYFALSRQPSSKRTKIERYWQSSPHEASDKFQRQLSIWVVEWGRCILVDRPSGWVLSAKSKGAAGCRARNVCGQVGFRERISRLSTEKFHFLRRRGGLGEHVMRRATMATKQ